jgi:hypothetical protein
LAAEKFLSSSGAIYRGEAMKICSKVREGYKVSTGQRPICRRGRLSAPEVRFEI